MLDAWPVSLPDCPPVAHLIREAFPDRWVRFHAPPESRRYPADEAEYAIVLGRYNTVLGALAHPGSEVVLLTTDYSRDMKPPRTTPQPWWSFRDDEGNDFIDPTDWHVFADVLTWQAGVFDPIFRRVADDEVRNVMVVDPDCRWLFHPYDGGMDLILDSPATRNHLRATYSAWLSTRPDGM